MKSCDWEECANDATKVVYRHATTDEQNERKVMHRQGASWDTFIYVNVCDEHLGDAQKEYPYIANEQP